MHRIFSGDGWLVFPDILKSARDHRPSQRLVQQPPVLIILCIDVPFIVLLDGSAQSRGAGARLAGKRSFPKGTGGFQRSRPPDTPHLTIGTTTPGSAGRPARMLSLRLPLSFPADVAADRPAGGNRMGPAEAEAGRRCRLIPVEEMAEAAGGFCAGGTPALPGGLPPMTGSHQRDKSAKAFWRRLSLKEVHQPSCLFVFIGGFVFIDERLFSL